MPPTSTDDVIGKWTKAISPIVPREGNRVDYLIDGWQTFASMEDAIATTYPDANSSSNYIYLLGWWLDDDFKLKTKTLSQLLQEAASVGNKVEVRAMLWKNSPPKLIQGENAPEIRRITALPTGAGILDNNTLPFGSHHQKILIVKGRRGLVGFCGGLDIAKDRVQSVELHLGSPFHDVHCRVEGPAVRDLVDIFVQRWQNHSELAKLEPKKRNLIGLDDRSQPSQKPKPVGTQYVGIARTFNSLGGKKQCLREASIQTLMLGAIKAAKRFIYIEEQYLVSIKAAQALHDAVPHIQHLTILIPHFSITDLPGAKQRRAAFIETVLNKQTTSDAQKVRIFYRISSAKERVGPERFGPHSYVHAKTWIFDDQLAVIGSANCNRRGWWYDSEVSAAIFDANPMPNSFAQKLRRALWAEHLGVKDVPYDCDRKCADLWLQNLPNSTALLYDPYEQTIGRTVAQPDDIFGSSSQQPGYPYDVGGSEDGQWDTKWDPSPKELPACQTMP